MKTKLRGFFFLLSVVVLLYLGFAKPAKAEDVTLTWEAPTGSETCTADSTVPDPINYRIYQMVAEVPGDTLTHTFPSMLPGDYTYVATTVATDTDGNEVESRGSGIATKTVATFKALAGATVYQPLSISTGFWMLPMGTVTADTDCDVTQRVNDYYRVPVEAVTWNEGTDARPVLVVTECK